MFTKYGISALLVILLSAAPCLGFPAGEAKLHPEEAFEDNAPAGIKFSRTAQYKADFRTAIDGARKAATKFLGQKNVAIVADIDETLLDNREFFAAHPEFKWSEFNAWIEEARAPALKPTAEFLAWARKNGFAVFLITGRMEKMRRGTIKNLIHANISYDGLFMRANGDKRPAQEIKTPFREAIEKMGFKVVVNIGDQWSDLVGGYAEDCEKLPNRMYFVP